MQGQVEHRGWHVNQGLVDNWEWYKPGTSGAWDGVKLYIDEHWGRIKPVTSREPEDNMNQGLVEHSG